MIMLASSGGQMNQMMVLALGMAHGTCETSSRVPRRTQLVWTPSRIAEMTTQLLFMLGLQITYILEF